MKRLSLLLSIVGLLLPEVASAQHSGVVLDFSGWHGKKARAAVLLGVSSMIEVSPRSRLGSDVSTEEDVSRAAQGIGASVVIKGGVSGRGKRAKTTIRIMDADGFELESARTASPATASGRKRIRKLAASLLRRALATIPEPEEDDVEDIRSKGGSARRVIAVPDDEGEVDVNEELGLDPAIDEPDPVPQPKPRYAEPKPEPIEEEPELTKATTTVGPRVRRRPPLITAQSGFTFRARSARIGQTDERNARHKSGTFPELTVSLRVTPFKPKSVLSSAFIQLDGFHGLGVASLQRTDEVATSVYRFAAAVGYTTDVAFLDVGGTVGIGHDAFTLGENGVMGAARYTYLRLGGIAIWALSDSFELTSELGLRPIFDVGEIGTRYGQGAGAFGLDFSLGFLGRTDVGFTYGITAGINTYALLFSAPGDLSPPVTATGGNDTSLTLSTLVGWQF